MLPWGVSAHAGIAGAVIAFGFLLFFYIFKLMGAGDVKFAAALGLATGWKPLFWIWVGASILAAIHAMLIIVTRRSFYWPWLKRFLMGPDKGQRDVDMPSGAMVRINPIPYGAYLSIAAWLVMRDRFNVLY